MIFLKRHRCYIVTIHYNKKNRISKSISCLLYAFALDIVDRDDLIYKNIKYDLEHCYYPKFYPDKPPSIVYNICKHTGYTNYKCGYIIRMHEYGHGSSRELELFYWYRDKQIQKFITPIKSLY